MSNRRLVFVTVGTTKFDGLIGSVLQPRVLRLLKDQGFTEVLIQAGNSQLPLPFRLDELSVILPISHYRFKPCLRADLVSASLIISHAGAGTCLEVQAAGKPHLVVINETLMGNHQTELAEKLASGGHLLHCIPDELEETLTGFPGHQLTPLGPGHPGLFAAFLDKVVRDIYDNVKK